MWPLQREFTQRHTKAGLAGVSASSIAVYLSQATVLAVGSLWLLPACADKLRTCELTAARLSCKRAPYGPEHGAWLWCVGLVCVGLSRQVWGLNDTYASAGFTS